VTWNEHKRRRLYAALATLAETLFVSRAEADDQRGTNAPPTAILSEKEEPVEVVVQVEREAGEAASRTHVGRRELELRPRLRPADLLEAAPGLFAVQHAGGGKANQYFLRGFDADHGTDVAFFVDGVPVNLVSHGHGQGFSDFHFLIPELVVGLDASKGPYYAEFGDFATAGAINLRLAESFEQSHVEYSLGQYGMQRALIIGSPKLGEAWRAVLAAEVHTQDGPFERPEDLTRVNLFGRVGHDLGDRGKLTLTWMSYASDWYGSGQIPARAVCGEGESGRPPPEASGARCIDRFGTIDPTEGGATQRHLVSAAYSAAWEDTDLNAMLYLMSSRFSLYSNFTFFRDDAVRGDQIEQTDDRVVAGTDIRVRKHVHYGPSKLTTTVGIQARKDSIENGLYHDERRVRLEDRVRTQIAESALGAFVQEDARLNEALRFIVGLRADRIDVAVNDRLPPSTERPNGSGTRGELRLSPKWTAIVSPVPALDLFVHYGHGFHSNDARSAVRSGGSDALLTRARGYELGTRLRPVPNLELSAAGFLLDLDSEMVWVGDEGTTEPSGATRRYGLELGARYRVSNWLFADLDTTFTRAEYRVDAGSGRAVALAPRRTLTAGIGVRPKFGDYVPFGGLRVKALADRPAIEDESLTADGFTLLEVNAGVRYENVELALDVQNVFDVRYREVNFASESRLAHERLPVTGIHYTPGWPRTVMGRAALYW
jgi:outer membrane receptor protein involved in Fe transport